MMDLKHMLVPNVGQINIYHHQWNGSGAVKERQWKGSGKAVDRPPCFWITHQPRFRAHTALPVEGPSTRCICAKGPLHRI